MRKIEYIKAQKLIKNPKKWNQGYDSIDCFGMKCSIFDANAIRWCTLGACDRYAHPEDHSRKELLRAAWSLGFHSIFHLNETGTHADVMKMFDLAIGYCEQVA